MLRLNNFAFFALFIILYFSVCKHQNFLSAFSSRLFAKKKMELSLEMIVNVLERSYCFKSMMFTRLGVCTRYYERNE